MRRYATGFGLVTLALGGCAVAKPPEVGYLAPTGLPPTARAASIQQPPELVFGNLVDRLQQDGFKVTHLDEQAGDVVVEYKGDPEPYVDCGWIVTYRPRELERIPAASGSASFDRRVDQSQVELDRELELDVRMMISLREQGSGTLVSPTATYVLTKTVDMARPGGAHRGRTHETISFATGGTGAFSKGTVCQPNGRLERVVLDSLPAVSVVASAPRMPEVTNGPVASEVPPAEASRAPAVAVADASAAPPISVTEASSAPAVAVADASATPPISVTDASSAPRAIVAEPSPAAPVILADEPAAGPASEADRPAVAPAIGPDEATALPTAVPDESAIAPAVVEEPPATLPDQLPAPAQDDSLGPLQAQVAASTAALSCGAVNASFEDGNRVRLTGHVGSDQDIAELRQSLGQIAGIGAIETDLEVDPWPMCELLGVLAPYRPEASAAQPALTVTTAARNTRLREGDDLTLDIYLPRTARYLYLGYIQHDGRVGYIATLPVREWAEGTGAIRFATGFQISEPYGREMIVAVASAHPLFDQARPGYEPADDYIGVLRERLATLQAGEEAPSVAVGHLFITTGPRGSS